MEIRELHSFNVTTQEAAAIQELLRFRLDLKAEPEAPIKIIAGADISYGRNSDLFFAAVLLFSYPEMEIREESYATLRSGFPYVPGLLSFREGPALIKAFSQLRQTPDLAIFDGQGIAHPRGFGLASHMGLLLDIPTIGCAKSRLVGSHDEVGERPGSQTPLRQADQTIGAVVRTKAGVKPVFVSQGQGIGLQKAVELVLSCCRGYRLPEPVRNAHLVVNRFRQSSAVFPSD